MRESGFGVSRYQAKEPMEWPVRLSLHDSYSGVEGVCNKSYKSLMPPH